MSRNVKVIDHGYARVMQDIIALDNSYTKVGFPKEGTPGRKTKKGSGHDEYKTIPDVATIAFYLEFGTKIILAIPFMQNAFDKNFNDLVTLRNSLYKRIISGTLTGWKALEIMGEFMTSKTKREIRDLREPENAEYTIQQKGSDNPLIDTGQMIQSVQHTEVIGEGHRLGISSPLLKV